MTKISRVTAFATSIPGRAQSYVFDRLYGVSTTADPAFSIDGDNNPYEGAQWLPVRRALRRLGPGPRDVFADLGSGKGRMLLIAGRLPYGRVIGVEIDEALSLRAQENIRQAERRLRATEITSVTASVLEWPVPDDLSIVFLFNPFMRQTFQRALERIIESYDRHPRDLRIIYCLPAEHDWLVSTGRVVVESVSRAFWPSHRGWSRRGDVLVVYRVVPVSRGRHASRDQVPSTRRNCAFRYWSGPNGFKLVLQNSPEGVFYSSASVDFLRKSQA